MPTVASVKQSSSYQGVSEKLPKTLIDVVIKPVDADFSKNLEALDAEALLTEQTRQQTTSAPKKARLESAPIHTHNVFDFESLDNPSPDEPSLPFDLDEDEDLFSLPTLPQFPLNPIAPTDDPAIMQEVALKNEPAPLALQKPQASPLKQNGKAPTLEKLILSQKSQHSLQSPEKLDPEIRIETPQQQTLSQAELYTSPAFHMTRTQALSPLNPLLTAVPLQINSDPSQDSFEAPLIQALDGNELTNLKKIDGTHHQQQQGFGHKKENSKGDLQASQTASSTTPETAERTQLMQRMMENFQQQLQQLYRSIPTFHIPLKHDRFGDVDVKVRIKDKAVEATFAANNPEMVQLLGQNRSHIESIFQKYDLEAVTGALRFVQTHDL